MKHGTRVWLILFTDTGNPASSEWYRDKRDADTWLSIIKAKTGASLRVQEYIQKPRRRRRKLASQTEKGVT